MTEYPFKHRFYVLMILLVLLASISVGIFTRRATAEPPVAASVTGAGSPPAGTIISQDPDVQQILEYESLLRSDGLSPEMRHGIQTKLEILRRVATQRALIIATAIITPGITVATRPTPTLPIGLREGGTSDFHAWEADIKNIWSQYTNNNEHVTVYAGELGSEMEFPGRGVLFVSRVNSAGRGGSFNRYLLPEGTGWVKISEVRDGYLVLLSKEGRTFLFYLPAQQFVTSLTEIAPTVTSLPTSRPLPTFRIPPIHLTPYP
jgi:hypothetical protein